MKNVRKQTKLNIFYSALDLSPSWKLKREKVECLSENSLTILNNKYKKAKSPLKVDFKIITIRAASATA